MSDGLDALMAQRDAAKRPARVKRGMPAVRHPRPVSPAHQDEAETQTADDGGPAAPALVPQGASQDELSPRTTAQSQETSPTATAEADAHDPTAAAADAAAAPADATPPPVEARPKRTTTKRGSARPPATTSTPVADATSVEADKVKPKTLSLTRDDIDWLDDVRLAGMMQRPKVDIPYSAVVRLALQRLREDVTVEEVRDHFVGRTGTGTPGRPRL